MLLQPPQPPSPSPVRSQPAYTYRRRSFAYIGLLLMLLAVSLGAIFTSGSFPSSSPTYNRLTLLAPLCFLLFAVSVVPFLAFAVKYWTLKRHNAPLPSARVAQHSVPVRFSIKLLTVHLSGSGGTLAWDYDQKIISLTSIEGVPGRTVFRAPFNAIRRFDFKLGQVTIWESDEKYICWPAYTLGAGARLAAGTVMGAAAVVVTATVMRAAREAGLPELADRLRAEGVEVHSSEVKQSFETGFDIIFGLLLTGALCIVIFTAS